MKKPKRKSTAKRASAAPKKSPSPALRERHAKAKRQKLLRETMKSAEKINDSLIKLDSNEIEEMVLSAIKANPNLAVRQEKADKQMQFQQNVQDIHDRHSRYQSPDFCKIVTCQITGMRVLVSIVPVQTRNIKKGTCHVYVSTMHDLIHWVEKMDLRNITRAEEYLKDFGQKQASRITAAAIIANNAERKRRENAHAVSNMQSTNNSDRRIERKDAPDAGERKEIKK